MASGVEVLQRRVAGRGLDGAALAGHGIHLLHIDALGCGNGFQLTAEAVADGLHMDAVTVAAYACAEDGLGQIVADVEAELAPHLFPDAVGGPEVQLCAAEQSLYGLDAGAVAGRLLLPEDDANGGRRVKMDAVSLLVGRHFDEGVKQMLPTHSRGNDVLAVHAVHQAHDGGMGTSDGFDAVQCAGQCAVFQADDEKVGVMGLPGRPDRRTVDFTVDGTAILLQALAARAIGHHAKLNVPAGRKPPDDIGADRTGSQNCNFSDVHDLLPHCRFPAFSMKLLYHAFLFRKSPECFIFGRQKSLTFIEKL